MTLMVCNIASKHGERENLMQLDLPLYVFMLPLWGNKLRKKKELDATENIFSS